MTVEHKKAPVLNRLVVGAFGLAALAFSCGILWLTEVGFNKDRVDALIPLAIGALGTYAAASALKGRWIRPE